VNGEGRPGGGTETADQLAKAKPSVGQIPPVGPIPTADVCLVGALLYSAPSDARDVLRHVRDTDIECPALAAVLSPIHRLIASGSPHGPQLVLDELRRKGELKSLVADKLRAATTSGADSTAARYYAGAVVAESLRRRIAAAGDALTVGAYEVAEAELAPLVARAAAAVEDCAERLQRLRGPS